ncbi:hypothetical protein [Hahella sp. HN01]|uniref:hypothetical protein n=1 Tax=Hahella sp. HN01 TaxID=2847262 RepID=UPI001C1ED34E|nr:hypothetical protein [Hahella sp. HN01]MBU6951213.1 hypothetical protein [Hahella sp. HN01]
MALLRYIALSRVLQLPATSGFAAGFPCAPLARASYAGKSLMMSGLDARCVTSLQTSIHVTSDEMSGAWTEKLKYQADQEEILHKRHDDTPIRPTVRLSLRRSNRRIPRTKPVAANSDNLVSTMQKATLQFVFIWKKIF